MTNLYHSQFIHINHTLVEGDQDQSSFPLLTLPHGTSMPSPISFDTRQQNLELNHHFHGTSNRTVMFAIHARDNSSVRPQYITEEDKQGLSATTQFVRRMTDPDLTAIRKRRRNKEVLLDDQEHPSKREIISSNSSSSSVVVVRVCSDCNTTKTPLWRSGPSGPKSLCNACGIRQRKVKRAMAAAAALSCGLVPYVSPRKVQKEKVTEMIKGKCRSSSSGNTLEKKHCFDDIVKRLSKSSAFQSVFPQDEKDAAILLMALSSGQICS